MEVIYMARKEEPVNQKNMLGNKIINDVIFIIPKIRMTGGETHIACRGGMIEVRNTEKVRDT